MNGHTHEHGHEHIHSLFGELTCHLPHAVFSVAFALTLVSFVTYWSFGALEVPIACRGAHMLFHSFHFMHIAFAATGTVITFRRFSSNIFRALLVGTLAPTIFCTLSDIVLPYIAGTLLGVHMHLHFCFATELSNVIPFLVVGIINGFAMSAHHKDRQGEYSHFSHAVHILISSLASTFYLVSHGFTDWYLQIGMVFVFLVIAVVVPCTLSDVVIPITFAKAGEKNEKHSA